jgi:thiol-disulfide isomerase/thioredoxin
LKTFAHLILLFAVASGTYADGVKDGQTASPAGQLSAIQQEYTNSENVYQKAVQSLPDTPDANDRRRDLSQQLAREQVDLFMAAVTLAGANPKSDAGLAALDWMLNTAGDFSLPAVNAGLDLMTRQYADSPKIGTTVANLAYYLLPDQSPSYRSGMDMLLETVAAKNPDRTVRGQAALGLAFEAKHEYGTRESDPGPATDALAAKAEKAFEAVLRDYRDCPNLRTRGERPATSRLGGEAETELNELRHLRIGQVAPEIEGEDLNGARFKLSDYRGKVVLLVFWASWCAPCMESIPREKALVEFKGRPFVLIGVNGDYSMAKAAKAVAAEQISWRSFWNGEKGPGGPVAMTWNVRGWPSMFVLDQQGIIRLKDGRDLETRLEELVSAAEKR